MQISLVALGTYGDVLPLIALAVALKKKGHGVRLAAPAPFEAFSHRAGIPFHSLGNRADYDAFVAEPDLWRPWRGAKAVFRFAASMTEPVYGWLAEGPDPAGQVVVASTLCLGARVAQDVFGFPLVMVHVMPVIIESRHVPPVLPGLPLPQILPPRLKHWLGRGADRYVIGPATLPVLNGFRARLGLPPVRRIRHWWNLGSRVILMFPDWYVPPQEDWPPNAVQVGFPIADRFGDVSTLSPDLVDFLDAGPSPLVFTYGSEMRKGRRFFETALGICERLKCRGVFLAPQHGQVPAVLPRDVIHSSYAPLSELLPRSSALIHHGGVGTVAQALLAGVPQLIVPIAFNHFDEAERVARLGVGMALRRRRFTPAKASRTLRALLADPSMKAACAAARDRVGADDGLGAACAEIERIMGRGHGSPER